MLAKCWAYDSERDVQQTKHQPELVLGQFIKGGAGLVRLWFWSSPLFIVNLPLISYSISAETNIFQHMGVFQKLPFPLHIIKQNA